MKTQIRLHAGISIAIILSLICLLLFSCSNNCFCNGGVLTLIKRKEILNRAATTGIEPKKCNQVVCMKCSISEPGQARDLPTCSRFDSQIDLGYAPGINNMEMPVKFSDSQQYHVIDRFRAWAVGCAYFTKQCFHAILFQMQFSVSQTKK